ncbi:MAG: hypothetical protein ABH854_00690 [Candidatus Diapherotrites archaeon]|nr:DUF1554 domain-containing protein [Candidatus Micrarchaeota archaeon]MBU1940064.1 DUF1554 domain-containing protein [Candidatus Micrarchaeota archaeon]
MKKKITFLVLALALLMLFGCPGQQNPPVVIVDNPNTGQGTVKGCDPHWTCSDSMRRGYLGSDCKYIEESLCEFGCANENCNADPCRGVTCMDSCAGDTQLYDGECVNGTCKYAEQECTWSCDSGTCIENGCKGVVCKDRCGEEGREYNGKCVKGVCEYASEECALGCKDAKCQLAGRVFVTSVDWQGDVYGIDGADKKCMERAAAAKLDGTWRAIISDTKNHAKDWLPNVEYRKMDGMLIAKDKADLLDGEINSPIDLTEFGKKRTGFKVWTGTRGDGVKYSANANSGYCYNWFGRNWNYVAGAGSSLRKDEGWINYGTSPCDMRAGLYCVLVSA